MPRLTRRRRQELSDAAHWIHRNRGRFFGGVTAKAIADVWKWQLARYGGVVALDKPEEVEAGPGVKCFQFQRKVGERTQPAANVDIVAPALQGGKKRAAATLRALWLDGALSRDKMGGVYVYEAAPRPVFGETEARHA